MQLGSEKDVDNQQALKYENQAWVGAGISLSKNDFNIWDLEMLKTAIFSVVKNEFPRIRSFLSHVSALFDRVVIVDHLSTDGTYEELLKWRAAYPRVEVYRYSSSTFRQSKIMTYLANVEVESGDADWLFFLDADEFLPFRSRLEFHEALHGVADHSVIDMPWENHIPLSYESKQCFGEQFLVGPISMTSKMALQVAHFQDHLPLCVGHGNHGFFTHENGLLLPSSPAGFCLSHIPIQSMEQVVRKVNQGTRSLSKAKSRDSHWTKLSEIFDGASITPSLLNAIVVEVYTQGGLDIDAGQALTYDQLIEQGYTQTLFDVAQSDAAVIENMDSVDEEHVPVLSLGDDDRLVCTPEISSQVKRISYDEDDGSFAALPQLLHEEMKVTSEAQLLEFMSNTCPAIDELKEYHLPFLFALTAFLKPRRYVELRPRLGLSLLAAGTMMKYSLESTADIVIHTWDRPYHPATFSDRMRDSLDVLHQRNSQNQPTSGRLRECESLFVEKSIDLIQMNMFHGYGTIREAYEAWKPKLTDNGCIVINDINEYREPVGMKRFFSELSKEDVSTYRFVNGGGLGVVAFGDSKTNRMIPVLQAMAQRKQQMEKHYCGLSTDRYKCFESLYVADYLKSLQKYSKPKTVASLVRWAKKCFRIPKDFEMGRIK